MLSERTIEICRKLVSQAEYVAGCVDDGISPELRDLWRARDELAVPTPQAMPDALSPEIKAAIGYCWRWVIHYAEKGVGLGPDRREFMEQQASLLCTWLDGLAKE